MLRFWRDWFRSALVIVLVITSFRSAIADWNDVPTGSMKPTILEGDRIVVNKLAYDLRLPYSTVRLLTWADPSRGDIIILRSPADGIRLVKRVVGVPGDAIGMINNRLVVNGEILAYGPLDPDLAVGYRDAQSNRVLAEENLVGERHAVMLTTSQLSQRTFEPIQVPEDCYFVMGDNRDESLDSRHFGFVDRGTVLGRATAVAASVDPSHSFIPRWQRFFHALR
ncbi:MAG: signal peptidase I [bacterium]|nr:signal peptidase I [bacterium]